MGPMTGALALLKKPGEPCWTHLDMPILARHCVHEITVSATHRDQLREVADWIEGQDNGTRGRFLFRDMPKRTYTTTLMTALDMMVSQTSQHVMRFECPQTAFLVRMKFG